MERHVPFWAPVTASSPSIRSSITISATGLFVGSVPIITANWDAHGEQWTLPVGAMAGRVIKLGGKLPINLLIGAYYNVLRPQFGATWQLRTQVAVVF